MERSAITGHFIVENILGMFCQSAPLSMFWVIKRIMSHKSGTARREISTVGEYLLRKVLGFKSN